MSSKLERVNPKPETLPIRPLKSSRQGLYIFDNIGLQNPFCFSKQINGRPLTNFSISNRKKIIEGNDYKGFVSKTQGGKKGYAIGTEIKNSNYKLPTLLDTKILFGLISLAKKTNSNIVKFNSSYELLKELRLPTNDKKYYKKLIDSIDLWSKTSLTFNEKLSLKELDKYSKKSRPVKKYHVSSVFLASRTNYSDKDKNIAITFDSMFLKLLSDKNNFAKMTYGILCKIQSPGALNLYHYLSTWKLYFKIHKTLSTNLKSLYTSNLGLSPNAPRHKMRSSIIRAIREINTAIGWPLFEVAINEHNVTFNLSNKLMSHGGKVHYWYFPEAEPKKHVKNNTSCKNF